MGMRNAAKCRKCERTGPKCTMHKVVDGGFVVGYEHDDCSKFKDFSKELPVDSIYDVTEREMNPRKSFGADGYILPSQDTLGWF